MVTNLQDFSRSIVTCFGLRILNERSKKCLFYELNLGSVIIINPFQGVPVLMDGLAHLFKNTTHITLKSAIRHNKSIHLFYCGRYQMFSSLQWIM